MSRNLKYHPTVPLPSSSYCVYDIAIVSNISSRKGTASASEFKEKQANVSKNLAGYINEERAGHFQYGLGFIVSHVSSKNIAYVHGDIPCCLPLTKGADDVENVLALPDPVHVKLPCSF